MKCTVVFESEEGQDRAYGLLFVPCPVWTRGDEHLITFPERPNYERGDLVPLLSLLGKPAYGNTEAVVCVVHSNGIGTEDDVSNLQADLSSAGFHLSVVDLTGASA